MDASIALMLNRQLNRVYRMIALLTIVEIIRLVYAVGYDYACYWGWLA